MVRNMIGSKLGAVVLAVGIAAASNAQAMTVAPGFDLLSTAMGTQFDFGGMIGLQAFTGDPGLIGSPLCPAGQFDFGGGCLGGLGNSSAIIQRLDEANAPSETIAIELVALSLISVNPIDLGFGPELIRARVLKDIPTGIFAIGQDLGSTMTIHFDGTGNAGTFDSLLTFQFDFIGATSGVTFPQDVDFNQTGNAWGRIPAPGAPLLPGVNFVLNGVDQGADFFTPAGDPNAPLMAIGGCNPGASEHLNLATGHTHCTFAAGGAGMPMPAPGIAAMMVSGAGGLLAVYGLSRRRRA